MLIWMHRLIQVWQQQFAWTEAGKDAKLVARALTLPSTDKLAQQPLFCVENMMHLLYFSCLVYDYKRVRHPHVLWQCHVYKKCTGMPCLGINLQEECTNKLCNVTVSIHVLP